MHVGSLLTSDDETVELGTHGGRVVRGVVRRRTLRLGWSERAQLALTQLLPVAVEVDGKRTRIPRANAQGRLLQRALLALVVLLVVPRVIARVRRQRQQ